MKAARPSRPTEPRARPDTRVDWLGPGVGFRHLNGGQFEQIDGLLFQLGYPNGRSGQPDSGILSLVVRGGRYCRLRPEPMPYLSALVLQQPAWLRVPGLSNGDIEPGGLQMLNLPRARHLDDRLGYVISRLNGELRLLVMMGQYLYARPIIEIDAIQHYKPHPATT